MHILTVIFVYLFTFSLPDLSLHRGPLLSFEGFAFYTCLSLVRLTVLRSCFILRSVLWIERVDFVVLGLQSLHWLIVTCQMAIAALLTWFSHLCNRHSLFGREGVFCRHPEHASSQNRLRFPPLSLSSSSRKDKSRRDRRRRRCWLSYVLTRSGCTGSGLCTRVLPHVEAVQEGAMSVGGLFPAGNI